MCIRDRARAARHRWSDPSWLCPLPIHHRRIRHSCAARFSQLRAEATARSQARAARTGGPTRSGCPPRLNQH
eukprot:14969682-Alexandrium_andersonii.AAC.1